MDHHRHLGEGRPRRCFVVELKAVLKEGAEVGPRMSCRFELGRVSPGSGLPSTNYTVLKGLKVFGFNF